MQSDVTNLGLLKSHKTDSRDAKQIGSKNSNRNDPPCFHITSQQLVLNRGVVVSSKIHEGHVHINSQQFGLSRDVDDLTHIALKQKMQSASTLVHNHEHSQVLPSFCLNGEKQ